MNSLINKTDEEVVEIVRGQNIEYFAEIVKRYQNKLLRYANYLLHDEHDADDVVQSAFIKAYINLNSFNINKKFSSWIYRIVHNEAMNILFKNKKQVSINDELEFDSGVDMEDDLIKKELVNMTRSCLDKIPSMYAEPLTLYYLEEKSYEDIGDILRLPMGTVATRINRAKKIMKSICQK